MFTADIYDDVVPEIENAGLDCECMGGGRIEHDSSKKKLSIYGHSQVNLIYYMIVVTDV